MNRMHYNSVLMKLKTYFPALLSTALFFINPVIAEPLYLKHLPQIEGLLYDTKLKEYVNWGDQSPALKFYPGSLGKINLYLYIQASGKTIPEIYCEGPKQHALKNSFYCHEYHGRVDLKKALILSCNSYFKKWINQYADQELIKFYQKMGWNAPLNPLKTASEKWSYFLGSSPDNLMSSFEIIRWLQNTQNQPGFEDLFFNLKNGRGKGTLFRLNAWSTLMIVGKTGTTVQRGKVQGVFAGWVKSETSWNPFVIKVDDSRGSDWPILFAAELIQNWQAEKAKRMHS